MVKAVKALVGISLLVCSLGVFSLASGGDPAEADRSQIVPTNFELLRQSVAEAIDEVCDRLPLHEPGNLCLRPETAFTGNWLVERALIQSLQGRGVRVLIPDSLKKQPSAAHMCHTVLHYRVVDLDLEYPASRRKYHFGPRLVERQTQLHFLFTLSGDSGEVLWTGETQRSDGDWILVKELANLERKSPAFVSPRLKADGWGRFAEPALLTAAVGGLIYFFYSTQ